MDSVSLLPLSIGFPPDSGVDNPGTVVDHAPPAADPANKVNFSHCLSPFINLLTRCGKKLIIIPKAICDCSLGIVNCLYRVIMAIQGVLSRLIFSPDFNPYGAAFKQIVTDFEESIPSFENRMGNLAHKFDQDYLIIEDIHELKQLGCDIRKIVSKLQYFVTVLDKRTEPLPIQPQLIKVKNQYQAFHDQLEMFYFKEGFRILNHFQKIVHLLLKGEAVKTPLNVRKEILQAWEELHEMMRPYVQSFNKESTIQVKMEDLKKQMIALDQSVKVQCEQESHHQSKQVYSSKPLELKNHYNSCWVDSFLQAFLCINQICDQVCEPFLLKNVDVHQMHIGTVISSEGVSPEDYQKELEKQAQKKLSIQKEIHQKNLRIQKEINHFIQHQKVNNGKKSYSQMEYILFLLGAGPSIDRLREAIFHANLHPELNSYKNTYGQHDPASLADLLNDYLLAPSCEFECQHYKETALFPGYQFPGPKTRCTTLQIALPNKINPDTGETYKRLENLLQIDLGNRVMAEKNPVHQYKFDPKSPNALIIDSALAASVKDLSVQKGEEFIERWRLTKLPSVMTVQLKRFGSEKIGKQIKCKKNNNPVQLPEGGIVDFANFYQAPTDGSPQSNTCYKIKSYIVHEGGESIAFGHYIAYVEIDGRYFECNDLHPNKEITEKEFYGRTDAYMIILERIDPKK